VLAQPTGGHTSTQNQRHIAVLLDSVPRVGPRETVRGPQSLLDRFRQLVVPPATCPKAA
jgi:hypothetical protein